MSYLVLARKYRPKSFGEVAGQDVVTRTLRGAIASERVGHAYLFFGPRGTGKTTSARLFAKALNCENGPTDDPCGTCARCVSYDAGTEPDLIEIDAASNTGVDHVRSLRDQAAYVPLKARFKVFLIDEVHMLSKAAFNALLKTLEEPPPHVKFLFATTELHKVPETVVSRCQVLRLGPLTEEQISSRLDEVFGFEGIQAEAGVSGEIARRARGGMRDALSLADQLLALVGREPTVADTERLAGEGSTEAIEAVLDAILAADKRALLGALPSREGDEPAFLDAVLDYLRAALLLAVIGEDAPMIASAASPDARRAMLGRAKALGAGRVEVLLQELLHARERMGPIHMRAHARLVLETTLLDLCRPEATMPLDELVRRLEALEGRGGQAVAAAGSPPPSSPPPGAPQQSHSQQSHPQQNQLQQSHREQGQPQHAPGPPAGQSAQAPPASRPPQPAPRPPQPAPQPPQAAAPAPPPVAPKTAYVPPSQRQRGASGESQTASGSASGPASGPAGGPGADEVRPQAPPAAHAQAAPPAPSEPPTRRRGRGPAPQVQTNSTADRWDGFIKELRLRQPRIADVVARKGKLVRDSGGVAPLKLAGLTDDEKRVVDHPDIRVALASAFSVANGDTIHLKVEVHDASRSGKDDAFTSEVAELFKGRVDD